MANFVRDGVAMQIPEASLGLLKTCFDKDDSKIEALETELRTLKDSLMKVVLDGHEYKAEAPVALAIKSQDSVRSDIDTLTATNDALKAELEKLKADSSDDALFERITKRRELERQVFPLLKDSPEADLAKESDRRLKELVVCSRYSKYSLDSLTERSDESINSMFEIAIENAIQSASERTHVSDEVDKVQTHDSDKDHGDNDDPLKKAYKVYSEDCDNAWKTLLNNKEAN